MHSLEMVTKIRERNPASRTRFAVYVLAIWSLVTRPLDVLVEKEFVEQIFRIGEASHPGPYMVGGASSSAANQPLEPEVSRTAGVPTAGKLPDLGAAVTSQAKHSSHQGPPARPSKAPRVSAFDDPDDWNFAEESMRHAYYAKEQVLESPHPKRPSGWSLGVQKKEGNLPCSHTLAATPLLAAVPQQIGTSLAGGGYAYSPDSAAGAAANWLADVGADLGRPGSLPEPELEYGWAVSGNENDFWERPWKKARTVESVDPGATTERVAINWKKKQWQASLDADLERAFDELASQAVKVRDAPEIQGPNVNIEQARVWKPPIETVATKAARWRKRELALRDQQGQRDQTPVIDSPSPAEAPPAIETGQETTTLLETVSKVTTEVPRA